MLHFIKVTVVCIPKVMWQFYLSLLAALFSLPSIDEETKVVRGKLGSVMIAFRELWRAVNHIWFFCMSILAIVFYLGLAVIAILLGVLFPFLFWLWGPLTAYRVIKEEKRLEAQYAEWKTP